MVNFTIPAGLLGLRFIEWEDQGYDDPTQGVGKDIELKIWLTRWPNH